MSEARTGRRWRFWPLLGLLLVPLSRAPQFLDGRLMAGSDECVLGLMAKHVLEGGPFPLFFQGQNYGLAGLEVAAAALSFAIFGVSTVSLKLAMLALWLLGWLFLVLAVQRFAGRPAAWIAAILLILAPSWLVFSMKARGIYGVGFLFSSLSLWLVGTLLGTTPFRPALGLALGFSLAVVCLSQPIWLLGLVPFVVPLLWGRKNSREFVLVAVGAAATLLAALAPRALSDGGYWSPLLFESIDPWDALLKTPERFWRCMTGAYYLNTNQPAGVFTTVCAGLWTGLFLWGGFSLLCRRRQGRRRPQIVASFLGVLAILAFSLFIDNGAFGCRYLLPMTSFLVIGVAIGAWRAMVAGGQSRVAAVVVMAALVLTGTAALFEADNQAASGFPPRGDMSEQAALEALIDDLIESGVERVYCVDPLLQWNIIFVSRERVIARYYHPRDRFPEYPRLVDRALAAGEPVAMVGRAPRGFEDVMVRVRHLGGGGLEARLIAERYFVIMRPPRDLLEGFGFALNE